MANAIENPFGYLVTPEDAPGIRLLQQIGDETARRRMATPGRGAVNPLSPPAPFPTPGSTMINRNAPPVNWSAPVPNPAPAPVAAQSAPPAPEFSVAPTVPEFYGPPAPPAPPAPEGIGPGIQVQPTPPVAGSDLPPTVLAPEGPRSPMRFGFSAGPPTWTPLASPPASRKYDKPEFIYTNPVAAQQAAANYATRTGADVQSDASYRDYAARLNAERNANERAAQQTQFSRENLAAMQAESAANRASAENISRTSELLRQQRQADADWQQNERLWQMGSGMADQMNKDPNNTKGIDRRFVTWDAAQNRWVPSIQRYPRPAAPELQGTAPPPPIPASTTPGPVAPAY